MHIGGCVENGKGVNKLCGGAGLTLGLGSTVGFGIALRPKRFNRDFQSGSIGIPMHHPLCSIWIGTWANQGAGPGPGPLPT